MQLAISRYLILVILDVSPTPFQIVTFKARKWLVFPPLHCLMPRSGELVIISGWNLFHKN